RPDGTGFTTLFTFDTSSSTHPTTGRATNFYGMNPTKALIQDAAYLYGVTPNGGANGSGTVFRIRKADGHADGLYSFKDVSLTDGTTSTGEGAYPSSPLTWGDGYTRLFGVTMGGGTNVFTSTSVSTTTGTSLAGTGTIYSLNVDGTGVETYSFETLDATAS